MNYDIKDLPYSQFELLGMNKKEVLNLKPEDLTNMLSGYRTGLIPLKISLGEGMQPMHAEAKLSLSRNPDNTLSLGVHPILAKANNTIDATPQQWEKMLKGDPIVKDSKSLNGQMEPHIHQLDRDTKEILSARVANIQIPDLISGNVVTPAQKEALKKGQSIEMEDKGTQKVVSVRLDLNEPKGFLIQPVEQKLELKESAAQKEQDKNALPLEGQPKNQNNSQEKSVVEAPSIAAGQKVDNKLTTAFIVNFHPKEQPSQKDSYLALNNDEIYMRVHTLVKDYAVKVERFDNLNKEQFHAIQQKPRDHYEGKGALVLASSENGKGVEIKDASLRATFEKQNALQNTSIVKIVESPKISEPVHVGMKR